jgi:probable F420-dependent oxidoreductase
MRFGMTLILNEATVSAADAARAIEERGFESMFVGEHTHLPVGTVHSYTGGGEVPDVYRRFPDPYVTLAFAAASTSHLRIGTCIALPAEHRALILAKVIATLDQASGGRFEFGLGYGWNPLETANNGFDVADRRQVLGETVAALRDLWTEETASADGRFVRFTESWSYPKPVQRPYPPILLGAAATRRNVQDMVEWASGWMPVRVFLAERFEDDIATVRRALDEAGRDASPSGFPITVVDPSGSMGGKRSIEAFDASLPTPADLARYEAAGVWRLCLGAPVGDLDSFRRALDRIVALRASAGLA